jgi:hypothetical protein
MSRAKRLRSFGGKNLEGNQEKSYKTTERNWWEIRVMYLLTP